LIEITTELLGKLLKKIPTNAHKGINGSLSCVVGSDMYRGAASLSVGAALRTGCGIVRLISCENVISAVASRHPCCTFLPVSDAVCGANSQTLTSAVYSCKNNTSAFLIGCGIGKSAETSAAIAAVGACEKKSVLDADALNILAENPHLYSTFKDKYIVTPHMGEMARLTGASVSDIKNDPAKYAKKFSLEHNCVTVLKDNVIYISDENGSLYKSSLGNEGLSKGGSGDVLAGLIAGFAAQNYSLLESAVIGTAVHGLSAELCASENGKMAMIPSDLEKYTVKLLASLGF